MEALGDDDKVVGIKHLAGANNGIQGSETSVVEHDIRRINACGNQILTHGDRLIIALLRVVTAQQQVVDLAAVVGIERPLNTVTVILVNHPGAVVLGGTEYHADLAVGQILKVIKDIGRRFPAHPAVEAQRSQQHNGDQGNQAVKHAL